MESRGLLLEGMMSVADYTIPSLQKALTKTSKDASVNYAMTVVDLANCAGFKTYLFSNQGHIDKKNTPITALSESKDSMGKRFIVLHFRGSHSSVCERIYDHFSRPLTGDAGKEDAYCYETTMRQTDYFPRQLDSVMKKAGESYSILYFADHGVSHNMIRGKLVMSHANPANHHRDVPLYRVSSDDKKLVRVRARRYLSNLTEGVSAWLGVTTEQLPMPRSLFRDGDDSDEYGVLFELQRRRNDSEKVVR